MEVKQLNTKVLSSSLFMLTLNITMFLLAHVFQGIV